jgi:uncharacterized Fe-S cluster-containing radical SAM superfamily enzyme
VLGQSVQSILDGNGSPSTFSLSDAIEKVQREDSVSLLNTDTANVLLSHKQAVIVGVAAVAVKNSDSVRPEDIE